MNFIQRFRNAWQDMQLNRQAAFERTDDHDLKDNYVEIPCITTPITPMPPLPEDPKAAFAKCRCLVCSTNDIFSCLTDSGPHLRAWCSTCGMLTMHRVMFKYREAELEARLGHRYVLRKVGDWG